MHAVPLCIPRYHWHGRKRPQTLSVKTSFLSVRGFNVVTGNQMVWLEYALWVEERLRGACVLHDGAFVISSCDPLCSVVLPVWSLVSIVTEF